MSVLLTEHTSSEILKYNFQTEFPVVEDRVDFGTARIVQALYNLLGRSKKNSKWHKLKKFLPTWKKILLPKKKRQSADDMAKMVMALNAAMGGKVIDKRKNKNGG